MNIKKKFNGHTLKIIHKAVTASTNDDCIKEKEDTLVVADRQTRGQGRMGRSFVSNEGGVYMSLSLNAKSDPAFITTAGAVAAAISLERTGAEDIKIKWVNDLYKNRKKVCGIIAKAVSENGEIKKTVLGVGVNLINKSEFEGELKEKAGYVFSKGDFEELRDKFINGFLAAFFELYDSKDKSYIKENYEKRDYLKNKKVLLKSADTELSGKAFGFDNNIGLIIRTEKGESVVNAGEVTVIPEG